MIRTTAEFSVDFDSMEQAEYTALILKSMPHVEKFEIDVEKKEAVVTSTMSVFDIQSAIEATGRKTIIISVGKAGYKESEKEMAAVATIGGVMGMGLPGVQGMVR